MPQSRYEGFGGKVALHAEMKAAHEKRKKAKAAKKKTEEKKPKPVPVYAGTVYRREKKKILRDAEAKAKRDAEKADTRIAADAARMRKKIRDAPFIPAFKRVSPIQEAHESEFTPFIGKARGRARTSKEYLSPRPRGPAPAPKKKRGWARKLKDALGLQFSKGGAVKKSTTKRVSRKKSIDGIARRGHTRAPHK